MVCGVCVAQPQGVPQQKDWEHRFRGQVLILRGMYGGAHLAFDAKGDLAGTAERLPLTLSALVVEEVKLEDQQLTLTCRRAGLKFSFAGPPGVPMEASASPWMPREDAVITIARDPGSPERLSLAVSKIFSFGMDPQLEQTAPACWRPWLHRRFFPWEAPKLPPGVYGEEGIEYKEAGDGVTPPNLLHKTDPVYPEVARRGNYEATDLIGLIVDTSGAPGDVHIVRPVGMGMDEAAVDAVMHYRFAPATRDGHPVAAAVTVQVSFELP